MEYEPWQIFPEQITSEEERRQVASRIYEALRHKYESNQLNSVPANDDPVAQILGTRQHGNILRLEINPNSNGKITPLDAEKSEFIYTVAQNYQTRPGSYRFSTLTIRADSSYLVCHITNGLERESTDVAIDREAAGILVAEINAAHVLGFE